MVVWFVVIALLGVAAIVQQPADSRGRQSLVRRRALHPRALDRVRRARLRRAGGHRLRGALRRHGPFRPPPDPLRLALLRAAGAAAQLFRTGRAGAVRSAAPRQSRSTRWRRTGRTIPSSSSPRWPPIIASPGGDLRRLLDHPAGGAARPAAAHGNPHTSATEYGQIYVPRINACSRIGVVLIVLIFKTSDALAAAYGIAVTGVMVISTFLVGDRRGAPVALAPAGRHRGVRHARPRRSRVPVVQHAQDRRRAAGCRSPWPRWCSS